MALEAGIQEKLESVLMPIAQKMSKQRHLGAMRDGMMLAIPVTVIGGFSMILAKPPIDANMQATNFFAAFLVAWKTWANANTDVLMLPYSMTIGIISVYITLGISYSLAKSYDMDPISNAVSALSVLVIGTAQSVALEKGSVYTFGGLGASSMFFAIVSSLLVVELNRLFKVKNITIKMPDVVPPMVSNAFSILIPFAANTILWLLLGVACKAATGVTLASLIALVLSPLVSAVNSLPGILFIIVFIDILWFFGIHPAGVVNPVMAPLLTSGVVSNAEAYAAGQPMPYILAGNVYSIYGRWTALLALCVLSLFVAKSAQLRGIAKVAIIPSIFDINEPQTFGIPLMFNVTMLIPQIICDVINFVLAYALMSVGLVGRFYISIPAFMPVPLAAFLSAMDWRALVLWVVEFLLDMAIILPFYKTLDKQMLEAESEAAKASAEAGE